MEIETMLENRDLYYSSSDEIDSETESYLYSQVHHKALEEESEGENDENSIPSSSTINTIDGKETPTGTLESKGKPQSRYYLGKSCHFCGLPGHLARSCHSRSPTCYLCGRKGHQRFHCPEELCFNCHESGHKSRGCKHEKRKTNCRCARCYSIGHQYDYCSEIWRQYHVTNCSGKIVKPSKLRKRGSRTFYCFNCGKRGHLGHDCRFPWSTVYNKPVPPFVQVYDKLNVSPEKNRRGDSHADNSSATWADQRGRPKGSPLVTANNNTPDSLRNSAHVNDTGRCKSTPQRGEAHAPTRPRSPTKEQRTSHMNSGQVSSKRKSSKTDDRIQSDQRTRDLSTKERLPVSEGLRDQEVFRFNGGSPRLGSSLHSTEGSHTIEDPSHSERLKLHCTGEKETVGRLSSPCSPEHLINEADIRNQSMKGKGDRKSSGAKVISHEFEAISSSDSSEENAAVDKSGSTSYQQLLRHENPPFKSDKNTPLARERQTVKKHSLGDKSTLDSQLKEAEVALSSLSKGKESGSRSLKRKRKDKSRRVQNISKQQSPDAISNSDSTDEEIVINVSNSLNYESSFGGGSSDLKKNWKDSSTKAHSLPTKSSAVSARHSGDFQVKSVSEESEDDLRSLINKRRRLSVNHESNLIVKSGTANTSAPKPVMIDLTSSPDLDNQGSTGKASRKKKRATWKEKKSKKILEALRNFKNKFMGDDENNGKDKKKNSDASDGGYCQEGIPRIGIDISSDDQECHASVSSASRGFWEDSPVVTRKALIEEKETQYQDQATHSLQQEIQFELPETNRHYTPESDLTRYDPTLVAFPSAYFPPSGASHQWGSKDAYHHQKGKGTANQKSKGRLNFWQKFVERKFNREKMSPSERRAKRRKSKNDNWRRA